MNSMTPRARVMAALDHQEPDRVPLDLGTGGSTAMAPEAYSALAAYFGLPASVRLLPHALRLAHVDEAILQALSIDTRPVYMQPARRGRRPCDRPGCLADDFGVLWQEIDTGRAIYREVAESPLAGATLDDLASYPWWPDATDADRFVGVKEEAERLFCTTDYAVVGCPGFNGVWERTWYLCGFERTLAGLLNEPEFIHAVLRRVTDSCKAALTRYLELCGRYIQVIKMGDDLGAQGGPLMSPRTYRAVVKPYHKELCDCIRQHSAAHIYLHTCGSVYRLLPDLIDAGFDILNPVQISAADMATGRLKAEYGDRLSFWGAIDTQHVLPFGAPAEVEAEVERRIADLGPGGGYVLAPVHNVQPDVSAENLVTMYRHAAEVGRYPLRAA